MNLQQPVALPPDGGTIHSVLGADYRYLVTSEQSGGEFALIEATQPPRSGVPWHVHGREDETFYILEGAIEVQWPKNKATLAVGGSACLPRNIPHCYNNTGDKIARYLVLITPGGFEKCLAEFAKLAPPTPEALAAIGQKYGLTLLPSAPG